jgi:hypothetical protein
MTVFNPRDWWDPTEWFGTSGDDKRRPEERNREVAYRWAMSVAFCICFASLAPPGLFAHVLASLLFIAGMASLALGCLQRQCPLSNYLTSFDEASWSLLASMTLSFGLGPLPPV